MQQAALVTALMTISRAVSVLCLLPLFVAFYRRFINRPSGTELQERSGADDATERTPLLTEANPEPAVETGDIANNRDDGSNKVSAAQELVICRISLLLDALGMLFTWRSNSTRDVAICTYHPSSRNVHFEVNWSTNTAMVIGSLGAAAGPSLQSLITLAAAPEEMGRVLAGKSALESAAVALRSPAFYALFDATLETNPGTIWLLAAVSVLRRMRMLSSDSYVSEHARRMCRRCRIFESTSIC